MMNPNDAFKRRKTKKATGHNGIHSLSLTFPKAHALRLTCKNCKRYTRVETKAYVRVKLSDIKCYCGHSDWGWARIPNGGTS